MENVNYLRLQGQDFFWFYPPLSLFLFDAYDPIPKNSVNPHWCRFESGHLITGLKSCNYEFFSFRELESEPENLIEGKWLSVVHLLVWLVSVGRMEVCPSG